MKRITFKNEDGVTFERVSRTIAKKAFVNGKSVYMCPDQSRPEAHGVLIPKGLQGDFEDAESEFRFYCCNKENGLRIAYYIELIEEPPKEAEFMTLPKGTIFRVVGKADKFVKLETVLNGGQNAVQLSNGRLMKVGHNVMTEEVDE